VAHDLQELRSLAAQRCRRVSGSALFVAWLMAAHTVGRAACRSVDVVRCV
jgi:hypothetical protein